MRVIRPHTLFSLITLFFYHLQSQHVLAVSLGVTRTSGNTITVNWSLNQGDPKEFYLLAVPWPGKIEEMRDKRPSREEILNQIMKNGNSRTLLARRTDVNANGRSSGTDTVTSPNEGLVLVVAGKGFDQQAKLVGQEWATVGASQAGPPPQQPQTPPQTQTTPLPPAASTNPGTLNPDSPNTTTPSPTSTSTETIEPSNGIGNSESLLGHSTAALGSHRDTVVTFISGVGTTTLTLPAGIGDDINTNTNINPGNPLNTDVSTPGAGPNQSQNLSGNNNTNLGMIIGLSVGIPLLIIILLILVFYIPRKRRRERRRRHLEQTAAFASNAERERDLSLPYSFRYGVESPERGSAQSVFAKHFKRGNQKARSTLEGFNPARMVGRAWSVSSRSSAPSLAGISHGYEDEKAGKRNQNEDETDIR